jgi:hypothetical protein
MMVVRQKFGQGSTLSPARAGFFCIGSSLFVKELMEDDMKVGTGISAVFHHR